MNNIQNAVTTYGYVIFCIVLVAGSAWLVIPPAPKSVNISQLANTITRDCRNRCYINKTYELECEYRKISSYVFTEIYYRNISELEKLNMYDKFPTATAIYRRKKARCVGQAVLFHKLMEERNFTVDYIDQPHHLCARFELGNETKYWNCFSDRSKHYSYRN